MYKLQNKKGFTLVELLIVILIIGILAGLTLSILNSGGIRQKARDSQRKADLKRIQTSLELYFADNRAYPVIGCSSASTALAALVPSYMSSIPVEPTGTTPYTYCGESGAYILGAKMELPASATDSPCANLTSSVTKPSFTDCYGVQNP